MKTKLLKEMRNEAYRVYGIKTKLALHEGMLTSKDMDGVYIIGNRMTPEHDVVEFSLKDAKKRLSLLRIDYCLKRIKDKRLLNKRVRVCRI